MVTSTVLTMRPDRSVLHRNSLNLISSDTPSRTTMVNNTDKLETVPDQLTQLRSKLSPTLICCVVLPAFCTSGSAVGYGYGPLGGNVRFGVANYQQELAGGAVRGYNGQLVPFFVIF
ncbi:hypothetical protein CDAR_365761 [Caerostris darwini]|uniref:Uncharacterized protein n=1 Tax=Caerostris darwini TaxID=1538125 RepID=A0AAV4MQ70_9ARAC|nr:hypothetical protein CDAR_365761 [Caerostris darwini]